MVFSVIQNTLQIGISVFKSFYRSNIFNRRGTHIYYIQFFFTFDLFWLDFSLSSRHQRSVLPPWSSAAPSSPAISGVWCSAATNAPSRAPATRPCSCICRSTRRSGPTSASSATTTAAGRARWRSTYVPSTRSGPVCQSESLPVCESWTERSSVHTGRVTHVQEHKYTRNHPGFHNQNTLDLEKVFLKTSHLL